MICKHRPTKYRWENDQTIVKKIKKADISFHSSIYFNEEFGITNML